MVCPCPRLFVRLSYANWLCLDLGGGSPSCWSIVVVVVVVLVVVVVVVVVVIVVVVVVVVVLDVILRQQLERLQISPPFYFVF